MFCFCTEFNIANLTSSTVQNTLIGLSFHVEIVFAFRVAAVVFHIFVNQELIKYKTNYWKIPCKQWVDWTLMLWIMCLISISGGKRSLSCASSNMHIICIGVVIAVIDIVANIWTIELQAPFCHCTNKIVICLFY